MSESSLPRKGISSGSTLVNLACSGTPDFAFYQGHYYYVVGDTGAGKTMHLLTLLAECCKNPDFDDYRLIYDNGEEGALMDMEHFFGSTACSRIEPPRGTPEEPISSFYLEDFYDNVHLALEREKPFVYVLDSMDVLSPKTDADHEDAQRKVRLGQSRAKESGSYGTAKARINSSHLRRLISPLQRSKSILVIISQTRDNVNGGLYSPSKIRSGGNALEFYATLVLWYSTSGPINRERGGQKYDIGQKVRVQVKKNRHNGRRRSVTLPIYYEHGIDEVGSMVDYLMEKGEESRIFSRLKVKPVRKRDSIIRACDTEEGESVLREVASEVWQEIEEALHTERRKRYN